MSGFEKVGGLIRQFKFVSADKATLGALQVVTLAQPVIDKWGTNKFGKKVKMTAVAYKDKNLTVTVGTNMELLEVRKSQKGLILQLNRTLGVGLINKLTIKVLVMANSAGR